MRVAPGIVVDSSVLVALLVAPDPLSSAIARRLNSDNLTAYDATYVALAEALGTSLLTGDEGIRGATGVRCSVELVG